MSLRKAINAKCRDCIVDEAAAGSAAVQVELCACYACPLWPVRPVRQARVPYSEPVCAEQGMSSAMAAYRLANPFTVPPEALCDAISALQGESGGEDEASPRADVGVAA